MSAALAERLYDRLPIPLQNLACSWYGLRESRARYGDVFHAKLAELQESEWWDREQIDAYQDERLRWLIAYAYERVPYYRDVMRARGVTPADIQSRADLVKLPILTKEDVRANHHRLLSERVDRRKLVFRHTSGTTGTALHFYVARDATQFQWALWWRHKTRFGLTPGERHANFTGKLVVPADQDQPPYWRWNWPLRQALLNMQHITPGKIRDILRFLEEGSFVYWTGYPSIIHALASQALEQGRTLANPPRVVSTGAENMLDIQRTDITRLTGAILTDHYGLSEACANASHCPELRYHEDFEFGIMECVEPETLPDGTTRGRIICTGFATPEFPLIRYDVGDVGVWASDSDRCRCGRPSRCLRQIEGRVDDYVVTPEGRRIMRFDYVFKDTMRVKECQVVQERLGEIVLRVVRRGGYGPTDEDVIRREIAKWISPRLAVRFDYVEGIERAPNGKFRAIRSLLR